MDLGVKNKAFVISGGTDGLGLGLAQLLIAEGADVAVCGRDPERLAQAQATLGEDAHCFQADVTNVQQLEEFLTSSYERFGRIDGLVNNAGRASSLRVVDATDQDWTEDFELKVLAAVRTARFCAKFLEETKGSVLNILAVSARTPGAGSTPTSANRAAGLALTKALSQEFGPLGVRVNALLIGLIRSGQWQRRAESAGLELEDFYAKASSANAISLGRFGAAEEFANVAAFLLSPLASYVTGVGISVDGGLSPTI